MKFLLNGAFSNGYSWLCLFGLEFILFLSRLWNHFACQIDVVCLDLSSYAGWCKFAGAPESAGWCKFAGAPESVLIYHLVQISFNGESRFVCSPGSVALWMIVEHWIISFIVSRSRQDTWSPIPTFGFIGVYSRWFWCGHRRWACIFISGMSHSAFVLSEELWSLSVVSA
jgi:hypothetical protein